MRTNRRLDRVSEALAPKAPPALIWVEKDETAAAAKARYERERGPIIAKHVLVSWGG